MSESDGVALLRAHVDAFNAGNVDALLAGFSDDAVWVTGATVARGLGELAELFSGAITSLAPELTIIDVLADGDQVACQMRETFTVAGQERVSFLAGFYRLRDRRITSAKIYREGSATVMV
jgi:ketosteroid isomerase-like protein